MDRRQHGHRERLDQRLTITLPNFTGRTSGVALFFDWPPFSFRRFRALKLHAPEMADSRHSQ